MRSMSLYLCRRSRAAFSGRAAALNARLRHRMLRGVILSKGGDGEYSNAAWRARSDRPGRGFFAERGYAVVVLVRGRSGRGGDADRAAKRGANPVADSR